MWWMIVVAVLLLVGTVVDRWHFYRSDARMEAYLNRWTD